VFFHVGEERILFGIAVRKRWSEIGLREDSVVPFQMSREVGEAANGFEGEFDFSREITSGIDDAGGEVETLGGGVQRMARADPLCVITQIGY
jgi:hypothetical protein